MSYSTQVFTYVPRKIVVILEGNSERYFMPQYAKTLQLNKGVDNRLQFQVINQAQKPQDITGKDILFRVIDSTGMKILYEKELEHDLPLTGITSLNTQAFDIEHIPAQRCFYTLEISNSGEGYPVFVGQSATARSELLIVDSILPKFVESKKITIPTEQLFPNNSPQLNQVFNYESSVVTTDQYTTSIQLELKEYTGNIVLKGATEINSGWYDIQTSEHTDETNTVGFNATGFHPYIKIEFESEAGEIGNIWYR